MSDDYSARLALPYLAAGQMQKHVTLNTALTRLDALLQTAVLSRTTAVQPHSPQDGDLYILPPGAQGEAWQGRAPETLMRFEAGGWAATPTPEGMIAVVLDAAEAVVRGADGWAPLGARLGEVQNLTRLGVGTTADAANPVAIKTNAALLTARSDAEGGDGDLRLTLNKTTAQDVLSLLFQSAYGGRAELGLIGGDDLSLKVSQDGETWRRVFAVDGATGRIAFDQGVGRMETTTFAANDQYAPPAWARWIEAVCVGGGGGGGEGAAGPAGSARSGGGGGGAGGLSQGRWPVEALTAPLSITVGQGGAASGNGGESRILMGAVALARATGGQAGGDHSGAAGGGGLGRSQFANDGGASSITGAARPGDSLADPQGPGGGGGGGGLSAGNAALSGGEGGVGAVGSIQAAGGAPGAAGQACPVPILGCVGGGGGGGVASATGAGAQGGDGGLYGAGGGGGGAGTTVGGAGGKGGAGLVRITAVG